MVLVLELIWISIAGVQMQILTTQTLSSIEVVNWVTKHVYTEQLHGEDCATRMFQFENITQCSNAGTHVSGGAIIIESD